MEEIKTTGIVLKSVNYGENDKIVTIFSLEYGKMSAMLKGVKKNNAKLKFASQSFCFAEFILTKNKTGFLITNANLIDSFYDLSLNYERFLIGCAFLEISNFNLHEGQTQEMLFITLLKCLKELNYNSYSENVICAKFILETLKLLGYEIEFKNCAKCGMPILNNYFFDLEEGNICCNNCKTSNCAEITKQEYSILKIINSTQIEMLNTIKVNENLVKNLINILKNNLQHKMGKKIKSLENF